jgi:hypothetical protein
VFPEKAAGGDARVIEEQVNRTESSEALIGERLNLVGPTDIRLLRHHLCASLSEFLGAGLERSWLDVGQNQPHAQ